MGNGYGKTHPVTDSRARERRKILNAQDSFVRKLVDNSGENIDDVDGDSVGPGILFDRILIFPKSRQHHANSRTSMTRTPMGP